MSPKAGDRKKPARKAPADGKKGGPLVLVDGSSYLYRAFHAMPARGARAPGALWSAGRAEV